ncbi:hypothetical protein NDU88_002500 [Pleurodeles waltl]|uniref:Uncharacterized protein n=1 Tax=Pleurodeles waltl TaxID=8319 RepID=A0AAV7UVS8_PLEWA|nr:hypothetical protein NDU88_002500 [Pleurodeles waltl]
MCADVRAILHYTEGNSEGSGGCLLVSGRAGPEKMEREFPFGGIAAAGISERLEPRLRSGGRVSSPRRTRRLAQEARR